MVPNPDTSPGAIEPLPRHTASGLGSASPQGGEGILPGQSGADELKQTLREMVAQAQALQQAAGGSVTDTVAGWLASQYLVAAREKLTATNAASRFEVLRAFLHDWTLLRRGDHAAARLQLDREELDWQRANGQARQQQQFREWLQRPEIRAEFFPERTNGLSEETLRKIERELHLF